MNFAVSIRKSALAWLAVCSLIVAFGTTPLTAQNQKPNIVMLMTDDTGWNDFGAHSGGGATLGHPTPNIDKMTKEGAVFTRWYGQATRTTSVQRRRRLPNSSKRTATQPTSPVNVAPCAI